MHNADVQTVQLCEPPVSETGLASTVALPPWLKAAQYYCFGSCTVLYCTCVHALHMYTCMYMYMYMYFSIHVHAMCTWPCVQREHVLRDAKLKKKLCLRFS